MLYRYRLSLYPYILPSGFAAFIIARPWGGGEGRGEVGERMLLITDATEHMFDKIKIL